jgi:hypothetical protein
MNKFVYKPTVDVTADIPTEMVINPLSQIERCYMPVMLRFFFTVNEVLTDTQAIEIPFINQRACDLVGACLTFSKTAEQVQFCHFPYLKDNAVWVDFTAELTKIPLASGDLINMYHAYFNATPSAALLHNLRNKEK